MSAQNTEEKIRSTWTGSNITYNKVMEQIIERWGEGEAEIYNPEENCMTLKQWNKYGYKVKKGERALKSLTYIEQKDEAGNVTAVIPKTVNLFYYKQVEEMDSDR